MLHNANTVSGYNVSVDENMAPLDHAGKQDANNDAFDIGSWSERKTRISSVTKLISGKTIINKFMTYFRIVFKDEGDSIVHDHR